MTRFWMVGLISILLSGCAAFQSDPVVVGGVRDYIEIPANSVITNVPLPTDEGDKKYNIVVPKNGVYLSLDAWNRIEKGK